jgi:hypothetical protein
MVESGTEFAENAVACEIALVFSGGLAWLPITRVLSKL